MTALAADRNTKTREQRWINQPNVAAAVTLWDGAMVSKDSSGNMRPARATNTDTVMGISCKRVVNAGSAGAVTGGVDIDRESIACLANSASADAITAAHIGLSCYVVDDQTVALTDNGGARPRAGKIVDVTTDGVWIDFDAKPTFAVVGPLRVTDVSAASDSALGSAPFSGFIRRIWSVLGGAITGADANVTPKIGSTAITGGALVIANVGSGADVVDFAHPTAANFVNAHDKLLASTGGESSTTATLDVYFLIEAAA